MCAIKHIITRRIQRNIPDQVDTDLIEARPERKSLGTFLVFGFLVSVFFFTTLSPDPTTYMYVRV